MSSEVENMWKSAMADAHNYVYSKLCGFGNYIDIIANSSMCSSSYPLCVSDHLVIAHYCCLINIFNLQKVLEFAVSFIS